ncbi:MAG: decarboxylating 6-phosphogluconate dehydrogenase [Candidatus Thiodiazotropha sp.]
MKIGMIGLGRMGASMVKRLLDKGHQCVVYDHSEAALGRAVAEGAIGAESLHDMTRKLPQPRVFWIMLPAAAVDGVIDSLQQYLQSGDTLIDGGNSHYHDDIDRANRLGRQGLHYLDVGTSGGVWGVERGYCLMIGGDVATVKHLQPIFEALAPGAQDNDGKETSAAERGWLHCGPAGAGHFVKMVHNGIEYGIMAAYAEGLNLLRHAGVGRHGNGTDAETAPMSDPAHYQYLLPVDQIAEVWRHGSVISSWLLDLTAQALKQDPGLEDFSAQVSDSGEGRWSAIAAVESGTPAPVLTAALFSRFNSQGEADSANRLLSAMRLGFGGHR